MLMSAICFGQTLDEDFEGNTFPPEGWTSKATGDIYKWETASYAADLGLKSLKGFNHGGMQAAKSTTGYFTDNAQMPRPNPDSWLITPKFKVGKSDVLNFMMGYNGAFNSSSSVEETARTRFELLVSVAGIEPADFKDTLMAIIPKSLSNWNHYSIDLSRFSGKEIYVAFHEYGIPSRFPMMTNVLFIDNVVVDQSRASDLSVIAVANPVSGCATEQPVKATIQNMGFSVSSFKLCYQVDEEAVVSEEIKKDLENGKTMDYTFSASAVLPEGATHKVRVWAECSGDVNHDNDTLVVEPVIGAEMPYPFTMTKENAQSFFSSSFSKNVGRVTYGWAWYDDGIAKGWGWTYTDRLVSYLLTSCLNLPKGQVKMVFDYKTLIEAKLEVFLVKEQGMYDIKAGVGSLPVSMDFKQGSLSLDIPEAGVYSLAIIPAEGYRGQIFLDNIRFKDSYDDVVAVSLDEPFLNATLIKDNVTVKATFQNGGDKTLTNVPVFYQLDEERVVEEQIASLPAGEKVQHTFTSAKLDLRKSGKHTLKLWSALISDGDMSNDTLVHSIASYEAVQFPYKASFEESEANENWVIYNPDADILYWEPMQVIDGYVNYAKDGKSAAYIGSAAGMEHNDWLISPAIRATAGKARISFYYVTRMSSSNKNVECNLKVYLTETDNPKDIDKNHPLTVAKLTDKNVLAYRQGYVTVDVPKDGIYYLAFYNDGQGHDIILDDVRFDREEDMCVIEASNSASTGFGLTDNILTLKLANHGISPRSNVPVLYTVNDGTPISEVYAETIQPGDTVTYVFDRKIDVAACDTFQIKAFVNDPADVDKYNNGWATEPIVHYQNAKLPYLSDFENDLERLYWTSDTENWIIGNNFNFSMAAYNGTGAIRHEGKSGENGDWIYSGCIELSKGTYDFSFFYRTLQGMTDEKYAQNFELFLGTEPKEEAMLKSVYKAVDVLVPSKMYQKVLTRVRIDEAGLYYIGIKSASENSFGSLYMDMFSITEPTTSGIELGMYEADFAGKEEEWYHYNPSAVFQQWNPVVVAGDTFMQTSTTCFSYTDIPTMLPGMYVAPAFVGHKGDEIQVSFDYRIAMDKPDNLSEEERSKIKLALCLAWEDMPQAFVDTVAVGDWASDTKETATGKFIVPEDGLFYLGFLADGPKKSENGDVVTTYDLLGVKVWNSNYNSVDKVQQEADDICVFADGVLLFRDAYDVRIYSLTGSLVGSWSCMDSIKLDGLDKGVYLVSIGTPEGQVIKKISVK